MKESEYKFLAKAYIRATHYALLFVTGLLYTLGALVACCGFVIFCILGLMFLLENNLEEWRHRQSDRVKALKNDTA